MLSSGRGRKGFRVKYAHVLVVARGSIFLIGRDVQFSSGGDRNVLITDGITGTNLWTFLHDRNCQPPYEEELQLVN
jgi:hypothetical protein